MKRHIISKFQGTIVVLTVLIAVTLVMTNPSTVLAAKSPNEYVDVVMLSCSDRAYDVYVEVYFYDLPKGDTYRFIGGTNPSCTALTGTGDADSMRPIWFKPVMWELYWGFWNTGTQKYDCQGSITEPYTDTSFPATVNLDCGSSTATVTIGTPRMFP